MRGSELFLKACHLRLKLAHLGDEGVVFGWFRAAFVRRQTLKRLGPSNPAQSSATPAQGAGFNVIPDREDL